MQFHDSMISLVGNTPLVRLNNVTAGIQATVLAKVDALLNTCRARPERV